MLQYSTVVSLETRASVNFIPKRVYFLSNEGVGNKQITGSGISEARKKIIQQQTAC